jgi:hypothetical protein
MRMLTALCLAVVALEARAQELPPELEASFRGQAILAVESEDLNRDGALDYLVVSEPEKKGEEETEEEEFVDVPRSLSIFVAERGRLRLAKRNDKVVYCARCGGVFGDPFNGVTVEPGRFTVSHYGGSNWRWTADYTFAWSRRDKTWQLVKVETSSFHTGAPEEEEREVLTPPKHFGKIDLADFDPDKFRGVGEK